MPEFILKPEKQPKSAAPGGTFEMTLFNGQKFLIRDGERVSIDLSDEDAAKQFELISQGTDSYSIRPVFTDGGSL